MIPAFVNDAAGSAKQAREALEKVGGFDVRDVAPNELGQALRREVALRPKRIVVAGGDGTVATAASATCRTAVELAVLPGGTLNHFARDHGIPTDLDRAAEVALDGDGARADVAYVGDRLFLNTASIGAYVRYVWLRERLEKFGGYRLASGLAAVRLFFTFKPISLELEMCGANKRYWTPLVFIGVGERELKSPEFGSRIPGGEHHLHVLVVCERSAPRLVVLALDALTRGLRTVARTPELDSYLADSCTVALPGRRKFLSVDGEIVSMVTPFEFRIERDALQIVVPKSGSGEKSESGWASGCATNPSTNPSTDG